MIMKSSVFLTQVDNSHNVFVTNTSFFTSEMFFKCMTELFSFDRPRDVSILYFFSNMLCIYSPPTIPAGTKI